MITHTTLSHTLRQVMAVLLVAVLLVFVLAGCKKEAPTSIYDRYNGQVTSGGQPAVTTISPTYGLGGVTVLTLTGTNFSPTAGQNIVFFNSKPGTILQATPTQLSVRVPIVVGDSVRVRVGVQGSELFSATKYIQLDPASVAITDFKAGEDLTSLTMDVSGNLYASLVSSTGSGMGTKRFTVTGEMTNYAPPFASTVPRWTGMKVGPQDTIYAVAHRNAIFRIAPSASPVSQIWTTVSGASFDDIDFDANGNIWGAGVAATGEGLNVYRIRSNKTAKAFPVNGNFRAVRVFSNFLYVGGSRNGQEGVWRMPILAGDSLGAPQQVMNMAAVYSAATYSIYALTFASDGDMYIGTDSPDGILVVHPNGTAEPLYPGILKPQVVAFTWGEGTYMYAALSGPNTTPHAILQIKMQKTGAPYYH